MEEERKFIHSAHERMHGVLADAIEALDEYHRWVESDHGNSYDEHEHDEARFALDWYDNILMRFCKGREWEVDALELRGAIDALEKRIGSPTEGLKGEIAQLRGRLLKTEAAVAEFREVFAKIAAVAGKD